MSPVKVRDYLLSFEHPSGQFKARFFTRLGFARDRWEELQRALVAFAQTHDATASSENRFGRKYIVDGTIQGPNGRNAWIRSVWVILCGEETPRFVTAYPGDEV